MNASIAKKQALDVFYAILAQFVFHAIQQDIYWTQLLIYAIWNLGNGCLACHSSCTQCSGTNQDQCTRCNSSSTLVNGKCLG